MLRLLDGGALGLTIVVLGAVAISLSSSSSATTVELPAQFIGWVKAGLQTQTSVFFSGSRRRLETAADSPLAHPD